MLDPTIKLKFDKRLDQEMAWNFYSAPKFGGCDFWQERALAYHPDLLKINSAREHKRFLNKYISEFYKYHSDELKILGNKTADYLNENQNLFFKAVDKIFGHYPWPQKEFIGCFSIFDFCPRFLDWGGFQIFLYDNRNKQLFTVFHEILHFIFYDFAIKNLPKVFKNMDTNSGKFWDLAEVFNAVIQNTKNFVKLHGKIKNSGYPNHKHFIQKGEKLWKENQNPKEWIIEMMKIV